MGWAQPAAEWAASAVGPALFGSITIESVVGCNIRHVALQAEATGLIACASTPTPRRFPAAYWLELGLGLGEFGMCGSGLGLGLPAFAFSEPWGAENLYTTILTEACSRTRIRVRGKDRVRDSGRGRGRGRDRVLR